MSKSLTLVQREYVNAMSREKHLLERAFEQATCRCSPIRRELDTLRESRTAFLRARMQAFGERMKAEYLKEFGREMRGFNDVEYYIRDILDVDPQIQDLETQVRDIDREDHPKAHVVLNAAHPFFRTWLVQMVVENQTLPTESVKVAEQYAQAWLDGWRPLR